MKNPTTWEMGDEKNKWEYCSYFGGQLTEKEIKNLMRYRWVLYDKRYMGKLPYGVTLYIFRREKMS